jgi:CheY-like chemotaxis protein
LNKKESVSNGHEGMERFRQEKPDLVTLDVSMPKASGTRFHKEIRAEPDLASIPVIIVTAVTGYADDPYAYEKFIGSRRTVPPPDAFFPKPIDKMEFLETVRKLLA